MHLALVYIEKRLYAAKGGTDEQGRTLKAAPRKPLIPHVKSMSSPSRRKGERRGLQVVKVVSRAKGKAVAHLTAKQKESQVDN